MDKIKTVDSSKVTMSQLMLPSSANFSGKIHGGYILSLLDQIAFASASKFTETYCVTASTDRVDFLNPVEVGQLLTMKASVNYVGNTSVVVGIRVESQNIQTGEIKHCNSSYFTMIAKNEKGENVRVPRLLLKSKNEIRRFVNVVHRIDHRKKVEQAEIARRSKENPYDLENLKQHYRIEIEL